MDVKKKKRGLLLTIISLLLIPGIEVLIIVGFNSSKLIDKTLFFILIFLLAILIVMLMRGLKLFFDNRNSNKRKIKKWIKILYGLFMGFYILGCIVLSIILYGPYDRFRTWLITTAMQTMNHQYFCKWFYDDDVINDVMSVNYVMESGESTDPSLIGQKVHHTEYNEYEKELMEHEPGQLYKIVQFEVNSARAFMAAIYDPSMLHLAVTEQIGYIGEYVTHMAERTNAILALNGGGFVDQGHNLGESPTGITIVNKEIMTNNEYGSAEAYGGIIGITDDNVLVLLKNKTADEAIEMGVRDAVSWGPFLVVNGVASTVSGNGGFGGGARSAIGQRIDGTILFLLVESNAYRTTGAGMEDLVNIMVRYGAYNAANLDGGTSSVMAVKRDVAINEYGADCHDFFTKYACAINDPIDAAHIHRTRYIADAWVVY